MFNKTLYNFISPVTGRVLADPNYVLIGNKEGTTVPSPMLIDIRLDLVNLRRQSTIIGDASFIIGRPNAFLPNAQVLSNVGNGFLYNTAGIVNTYNIIPIYYLPRLTEGKIWVGDIFGRPYEVTPERGPEGPMGPRGYPGISFKAIMRAIFDELPLPSWLKDAAESLLNEAFEKWLEAYMSIFYLGIMGAVGAAGTIGLAGKNFDKQGETGRKGAAGDSSKRTEIIKSNLDMTGHRIENLSHSPATDFSLINAKWVEDLLNNQLVIQWQ